ncbi:hypothetical protein FKM82_017019 [Ascaphus truei]
MCGSAAFLLGYCIYFDRRRRRQTDVRRRRWKKRRKERKNEKDGNATKRPDPGDSDAAERFILKQVLMGEQLERGEYEQVEHLNNVISVFGYPPETLQVSQLSLPPPVFQKPILEAA